MLVAADHVLTRLQNSNFAILRAPKPAWGLCRTAVPFPQNSLSLLYTPYKNVTQRGLGEHGFSQKIPFMLQSWEMWFWLHAVDFLDRWEIARGRLKCDPWRCGGREQDPDWHGFEKATRFSVTPQHMDSYSIPISVFLVLQGEYALAARRDIGVSSPLWNAT